MDEAVHVLIVRGKGEKFFSAGADIKMLASANPRFKYYFCLHANETLLRLEQTPKLVIAALNGHAVGADWRSPWHAISHRPPRRRRIGLPEVNLGFSSTGAPNGSLACGSIARH